MTKPPLLVHGMHGLGDCLHQRAVLRELMQTNSVWLESSWASLYHDLIAQGLHVVRKSSGLRTQAKNSEREAALFDSTPAVPRASSMTIAYNIRHLQTSPTVLHAMFASCGLSAAYDAADYRLPIPDAWYAPIDAMLAGNTKPVMVYRPLVMRPEWTGSGVRNADPNAYAALVAEIRDTFYVVSVADVAPQHEWIVGPHLIPDKAFHSGELPFESLAALFSRASLVFTSGGFGVVLAPAVSTPVISIVGGYERAAWGSSAARFAPYLGIEPIHPCACASSGCQRSCDKTIDIHHAALAVREFCAGIGIRAPQEIRPLGEMFTPAPAPPPPPAEARLRPFVRRTNPLISRAQAIAERDLALQHLGIKA